MEQNQASKNTPRQAILLDLSLFILDLLDTNKIKENASVRDHILEVPSALVQMLRDSRVGSPVLFLFIYALLVKTINKYRAKQIADSRIARLVNSQDYEVRGEAWRIAQKLFEEFSSLIDIAPKTTLPEDIKSPEYEYKSGDSDYPIRRYDFIGSLSREEQLQLQQIYTRELNLPVHPLYDQYFSQIFHAQSIGVADVSSPRRRSVSLDNETFKVVAEWKGRRDLKEDSHIDSDIVDVSRKFLTWFVFTYLKDEWRGIVFDKKLDLSVAMVTAGTVTGSLGVSLVTLAGGTILKAIAVAPSDVLPPDWKPFVFVGAACLFFACLIALVKPTWFRPKVLPTPSGTPLSISQNDLLSQDLTLMPSATSTAFVIVTVPTENFSVVTLVPLNPTNMNASPDYCLYVVQPNDTVQSVASWFYVSELDIRNSDARVNRGMFALHQLVRINAPCCTHIGVDNGRSYSVQPKDNVFRLAENYLTSVAGIVSANNLNDSHYIQTGQMLCIPYR